MFGAGSVDLLGQRFADRFAFEVVAPLDRRCGQSANKPYCDGTHASIRFNDRLEGTPEGKTLPEKVY